jgi:hypothetical protein
VIHKWDGSFDWAMIFLYILGAMFQISVYMTIVFTFDLSIRAGLNIGISTSIWAINPFLTAMLDRFLHKTQIQTYQMVGMLTLCLCGILVSLSEFVTTTPESELNRDPNAPPIYLAVLMSFLMPVICCIQAVLEKYVVLRMGVTSSDWCFGYWGLLGLAL